MRLAACLLLVAGAASAQTRGEAAQFAADNCKTQAAELRQLGAECRAETPPCQVKMTGPNAVLQDVDYTFTPDQADEVAAQWVVYGDWLSGEARKLRELDIQIVEVQVKIAKLGFEKRGDEYAEYLTLAKGARDELDAQTRDLIAGKIFDGEKLAEGVAGLSRGKAEKIVRRLRVLGPAGDKLIKLVRKLARVKARREKAEAVAEVIAELKQLWEAHEASADIRSALLFVLSQGLSDPRLELLIEEIEWTTAAAYALAAHKVADAQIERLTEMTEGDLRALKSLTRFLEKLVGRSNTISSQLKPCHVGAKPPPPT